MYLDYVSLFFVFLAILVSGILLGKTWSYFSSREETEDAKRLVRGSSSYVMGMNYLISNQHDLAIMELSRAAKQDPDAVEIHTVLGNLYREKGQVERAIQIHRGVLQRRIISPSERNLALFCLGLDYKNAGFVDRAIEVFEQLVQVDPADERALSVLVKLYEEVGQLDKAYRTQQDISRIRSSQDRSPLAFLEVEMGKRLMDQGEMDGAERRFQRAIDMEPRTYPAYIYYGDLLLRRAKKSEAIDKWERMVRIRYKRAHLVFGRLEQAYQEIGKREGMEAALREVMKNLPYDWRSRIYLAEIRLRQGRPDESYELLKEAVQFNPHSLAVHQRIWKILAGNNLDRERIQDYLKLSEEIIFFLDPFICLECGYKTTEFLWKCPHCHSWDTFSEVRI